MLFTSFTYIAFILLAVPLVRATTGVWRERVLLAASFVYYSAWDVRMSAVLIGIGALTYYAGRRIAKGPKRLALVVAPIAFILVVLSVFKYTGMLAELANLALPPSAELTIPKIVLPLGISFFTFECISYLLDVYRGEKELLPLRRFLLFPAYWPHLVAGPILRIKELGPQLENPRRPSWGETLSGVDRLFIGLFKKVVLADSLATFVDQGFAAPAGANSAVDSWALAIGFALQIYLDFSAYTDIAIGVSRMIGITLPENFNLPYHADSPSDFWNRWHMTLSRWIRDYLFFPLNMRAGKRIWLRYVYLVLVMTLVGLWHGAGPGFILWGAWHGVLMVSQRVLSQRVGRLDDTPRRVLEWIGRLAGLALIVAGWVLFRAPSLAQAGAMLRAMFTLRGLSPAYSVNDYLLILFCMALYFFVAPAVERHTHRDPRSVDWSKSRWTFWLRAPAYAAAVQLLFMFDKSNVSFIYFQF
jgi:alginate O-acetyltransferase complex protein AlgI